MPTEDYVSLVRREFDRLKRLADGALAQVPADWLFTTPGEGDNSVAVIMKHLSGNMLSRWRDFLSSDGEKPDRKRDTEFVISTDDSREKLFARWEEGWTTLFDALEPLRDTDLNRTITIRGEPMTVLQAINRQLTHYAYHVGQVVYLAKHLAGREWKSLSIPLGQSEDFNRGSKRYLEKP